MHSNALVNYYISGSSVGGLWYWEEDWSSRIFFSTWNHCITWWILMKEDPPQLLSNLDTERCNNYQILPCWKIVQRWVASDTLKCNTIQETLNKMCHQPQATSIEDYYRLFIYRVQHQVALENHQVIGRSFPFVHKISEVD